MSAESQLSGVPGGARFKLSGECAHSVRDAHEGGVKALAALSDDVLVSGGDDKTCCVWRRLPGSATEFACAHICPEHQAQVRAVLALPTGAFACCPRGGFATGALDKLVRVYAFDAADPAAAATCVRTLQGHAGGVISLALTARGELVSGGWDGQARVWDVEAARCAQVLEGHENGTCVLGLANGDIACGSTGRKNEFDQPCDFKIRIWTHSAGSAAGGAGGRAVPPAYIIKRMLEDHAHGVRDLAALPGGVGFVSASNDGTVRARALDGSPLAGAPVLTNPPSADGEGHPVFCFSAHVTPAGLVATCNESQSVRIYSADGQLVDELPLPGTPWRCASLPNGDLAVATDHAGRSARGHLYVFSEAAARRAPEDGDAVMRFRRDIVRPKASAPSDDGGAGAGGQGPDGIVTSGPYAARASRPGTKDGQNGFFVHAEGTMYCTWSAAAGAWTDVGLLQDAPGDAPMSAGPSASAGAGAGASGAKWDYTRAVSIDTPGGTRSLQLSWNEGDDVLSVAKNFLAHNGLDEDSYEEVKDFIYKVQAAEGDAVRRRRAAAGGGARALQHLPSRQFIDLSAVDWKKVLPKLLEVARAQPAGSAGALSAEDEAALTALVSILEQTSKWHATSAPRAGVHALLRAVRAWAPRDALPALDALRVLILHSDGARAAAEIAGEGLPAALVGVVRAAGGAPEARASTLVAARALFNCFRSEPTRRLALAPAALASLLDEGACVASLLAHEHATVRYAGAVLLHNVAHAALVQADAARKARDSPAPGAAAAAAPAPPALDAARVRRVVALAVAGLAGKEDDARAVLLIALGTALRIEGSEGNVAAVAAARELGAKALVEGVAAAAGAASAPVAKELLTLL